MLRPFRLHEPTTAKEAVSLLGQYGDQAKAYAGGTELLLAMKEGLLNYDHLVNVKSIPGMDDIFYDVTAGFLHIGPTTTHRDLELSPIVKQEYPLLSEVERSIANIRVRNVGTIGGNLCFSEPHSDPGVFLSLFDATVEVLGSGGQRSFSVEEMLLGPYETCLEQEELLTQILVPSLPQGMKGAYFKFGYHERPTLSLGVAVKLTYSAGQGRQGDESIEEVRIALGSISPKPVRVREAEDLLRNRSIEEVLRNGTGSEPSVLEAATQLAIQVASPVSDIHGSTQYKEHLTKVYLRKAFTTAVDSITEQSSQ